MVSKSEIHYFVLCVDEFARQKNIVPRDAFRYLYSHGGIEHTGVPVDEAMNQFYNFAVFEKLGDYETGLYLQSAAYVYDLFLAEKRAGHLVQLEI